MIIDPRGTARWLVENTSLTFEQIGSFTDLHYMEVEAIANDEVRPTISNPLENHQLTREEIERCENNPDLALKLNPIVEDLMKIKKKTKKYKPLSKRNLIPSAILFMVMKYPKLSDGQITRLIGTTVSTVGKIRDGSYKGLSGLSPKDPVLSGFCTQAEIDKAIEKAQVKEG